LPEISRAPNASDRNAAVQPKSSAAPNAFVYGASRMRHQK
jgi:hypothetical protein